MIVPSHKVFDVSLFCMTVVIGLSGLITLGALIAAIRMALNPGQNAGDRPKHSALGLDH